MEFVPRKLLFKAWNRETGLLMRLNSIDCVKGELFKKDHILLQFTGLYDKQNEEIYEMDMVLIGGQKYIVHWNAVQNGWGLSVFPGTGVWQPFQKHNSDSCVRICNYFESRRD